MVRRRYENGEYKELNQSSELRNIIFRRKRPPTEKSQFIKDKSLNKFKIENPAIQYFNWVKSLGINFKTESLTTTEISTYRPDGKKVELRPTDPCYCGSGKKYGQCHLKQKKY